MNLRARAFVLASRTHGENGALTQLFTRNEGRIAGYVAGARSRQLRPVLIPGNLVEADLHAKSPGQLPFAKLELVESRGPWLTEPLPASAIAWSCSFTASILPERSAYLYVYEAFGALLDAICRAPSARGWLAALTAYEALVLRELGYGGAQPDLAQPDLVRPGSARPDLVRPGSNGNLADQLTVFESLETPLRRYLLADCHSDVMGARQMLKERLVRMA